MSTGTVILPCPEAEHGERFFLTLLREGLGWAGVRQTRIG